MDNSFVESFLCDGSSTEVFPYRGVIFSGTAKNVIPPAAAGDRIAGVTQQGSDRADKHIDVRMGGRTRCEAASAITFGDRVRVSGTDGKIETAAAALTTVLGGANNDMVFTAIGAFQGVIGDGITIEYIDPSGASQSLAVTVHGFRIKVSLATDTSSAITSTATLIAAAIAAHAVAKLMVVATNSGSDTGAGAVIAMAEAGLTGGAGDFATALEAAAADTEYINVEVD